MCAPRPTITSSPGRQWSSSAIWFAIVPLGTNSAASLPSSAAARASSAAAVGSSPQTSSPTSAPAIAARIGGRRPRERVRPQIDDQRARGLSQPHASRRAASARPEHEVNDVIGRSCSETCAPGRSRRCPRRPGRGRSRRSRALNAGDAARDPRQHQRRPDQAGHDVKDVVGGRAAHQRQARRDQEAGDAGQDQHRPEDARHTRPFTSAQSTVASAFTHPRYRDRPRVANDGSLQRRAATCARPAGCRASRPLP